MSPHLWYDVALFYNDYDDLRTGEAGGQLGNLMSGHSSGVEVAVRWEPTDQWRIDTAYTWLAMGLNLDPASTSDPGQLPYIEGLAARNQASIRSALDLPRNIQLDTTLRYVAREKALAGAALMADPAWRARAFEHVVLIWARREPAAAARYVEECAALSPAQQADLRRKIK